MSTTMVSWRPARKAAPRILLVKSEEKVKTGKSTASSALRGKGRARGIETKQWLTLLY